MSYNRENLHFDRSRLLIGTYCVQDYVWDEAHVQALAHAGIDYLCATPADPGLLDRCQKHGIGVFATGIFPGWWGGDGDRAGQMADTVPVSAYEAAAEKFRDHPAIWGIDTGDEPSALDFAHYGKLFEAAYRLFPNQMPYLNLYPNYASVAENTAAQTVNQLGTATYQEHIDRYAELVDTDYICYDHYMYSTRKIDLAYDNLRIVADKCRETGRDFWIVLQVNSNRPEEWISLNQLRHQAYTAMAFGAVAINWACWTAGWWKNQVFDENGVATEQYGKLCAMNREIKAIGERYMGYRNRETHFVGFAPETMTRLDQKIEASCDLGAFRGIRVDDGCGAVVGYMVGESGDALMIADGTNPYGTEGKCYSLRFRAEGKVSALMNGLPVPVVRDGDEYVIHMEPCAGVFVYLG